ncbi:MAG: hypothetical protein HYZ18_08255 [Pseudogulbenkiania sp.]|nr:hypothetical protein [Pseudogulbenkiania sp.]
MIAVDLFADFVDWNDKQRERGHRFAGASRTLFMLARGARTASPLVFVDAALATLDAVGAYARYRQAKEITAQLEAEADMLRRLLVEINEQLRIEAHVAELKFGQKMKELRHRMQQQALEIELSEECFNSLSRQIKQLGVAIAEQRLSSVPNCLPLLCLEAAYYELVDLQLQTALDLVKE